MPAAFRAEEQALIDDVSAERLNTRLVRERNRVVHGIIAATRAVERALAALSGV